MGGEVSDPAPKAYAAELQALAGRIDHLATERGLSYYRLARRVGIAPSTIGRFLRGGSTRVLTMHQVADALDCDVVIEFRPRSR